MALDEVEVPLEDEVEASTASDSENDQQRFSAVARASADIPAPRSRHRARAAADHRCSGVQTVRREDFIHVLQAADAVVQDELVVVGSQAVLGTVDAPSRH